MLKRSIAVCLLAAAVAATPGLAAAQVVSGSNSQSNSVSGSHATAGVDSSNNSAVKTDVTINESSNSNVKNESAASGFSLLTPPGSSCSDVTGAGVGTRSIQIGLNIPHDNEICIVDESVRMMLNTAQAAEVTLGHGAGRLDVLAARNRLRQVPANEAAYVAAQQQLDHPQGPTQ